MYIGDLIDLTTDTKVMFEIIEKSSGASFGFYTNSQIKNSIFYKNYYILVAINTQYINGNRVLVLYF